MGPWLVDSPWLYDLDQDVEERYARGVVPAPDQIAPRAAAK